MIARVGKKAKHQDPKMSKTVATQQKNLQKVHKQTGKLALNAVCNETELGAKTSVGL